MRKILLTIFLICSFLSISAMAGPPRCPCCERWNKYKRACVGVGCGGNPCLKRVGCSCCTVCWNDSTLCCVEGWGCADRCGGSGGPCCAAEGKACCPGTSGTTCCEPGVEKCCDGQCYNKETQGCCGGQIYNLATHSCCDDLTPYDRSTKKCCYYGTGQICDIDKECCDGDCCDSAECKSCVDGECKVCGGDPNQKCCDGSCCSKVWTKETHTAINESCPSVAECPEVGCDGTIVTQQQSYDSCLNVGVGSGEHCDCHQSLQVVGKKYTCQEDWDWSMMASCALEAAICFVQCVGAYADPASCSVCLGDLELDCCGGDTCHICDFLESCDPTNAKDITDNVFTDFGGC